MTRFEWPMTKGRVVWSKEGGAELGVKLTSGRFVRVKWAGFELNIS